MGVIDAETRKLHGMQLEVANQTNNLSSTSRDISQARDQYRAAQSTENEAELERQLLEAAGQSTLQVMSANTSHQAVIQQQGYQAEREIRQLEQYSQQIATNL